MEQAQARVLVPHTSCLTVPSTRFRVIDCVASGIFRCSSRATQRLKEGIMMDFNSYREHDGLALGELVRRGEVTALELLETAIARVEAVNEQINAIVWRGYDQAR